MYKRGLMALAVAVSLPAAAVADPWFVRGDFNGWSLDDQMTEVAPGHYQATVTGLTDGATYEFKVADEDWTADWPGSNARIRADASGELTVNLWFDADGDGWSPAGTRVGYEDLGFTWEIMGSFNDWVEPVVTLTHLGDGVHQGQIVVAEPDDYWFKFRNAGDWDVAVGTDFGTAAGDIPYTTTTANETVIFTLDLPGGRFNVVPEPGSLALLGLGGLMLLRRRR